MCTPVGCLQIKASEAFAVLDFLQYCYKLRSENFSRAARLAISLRRIYGGFAAVWRTSSAAKRAFCHGMVKNQQCSTTEPPKISRRYKFRTSKFPTIP
jgi:hypothetical protein